MTDRDSANARGGAGVLPAGGQNARPTRMHKLHGAMVAFAWLLLYLAPGSRANASDVASGYRPPAVPLVAHDPYFSVWSFHNELTGDWARHWTGAINAMCGMARIDGQTFRFAGLRPETVPAMKQVNLEIWPTRTIYTFEEAGVRIVLTFTTPILPEDLDLVSRPVTYVAWSVSSIDEKPHAVSIYFDATAEWCVDQTHQAVDASRLRSDGLELLRFGTKEQPVLGKVGDNRRIDWGYFYLALPTSAPHAMTDTQPAAKITHASAISSDRAARGGFIKDGRLPAGDDLRFPRAANDDWPVMACTLDLGEVGGEPVSRYVMLAYDDQWCIEYFKRPLVPYWRRGGVDFDTLLRTAAQQYLPLVERCKKFDEELTADLLKVGGLDFAQLATLAYRQAFAAHKLAADFDGTPLYFPKENFSNGCISTVDVFYPSAPIFLLLNPKLLVAQLVPVLEYARSPRWPFPFAPHDLGTYPKANGQVYGGGERTEDDQMPVEESANMLILIAALGQLDGKAALQQKYPSLTRKWAEYLDDKGFDPANQLCTDDFAGHLAHNTNLSAKAIVALGAYARACELAKQTEAAQTYRNIAETLAKKWVTEADDGDHFRLTFDKPGTWSQKYNLVWDRVLDLRLFPAEVAKKELAYYRTKMNKYGLPLDSRKDYTKLDWLVWTATLTGERSDLEALLAPAMLFVNETQTRVPLTDWYSTESAKQSGFQARSVVGGVFMPMLADKAIWEKWSKRAK